MLDWAQLFPFSPKDGERWNTTNDLQNCLKHIQWQSLVKLKDDQDSNAWSQITLERINHLDCNVIKSYNILRTGCCLYLHSAFLHYIFTMSNFLTTTAWTHSLTGDMAFIADANSFQNKGTRHHMWPTLTALSTFSLWIFQFLFLLPADWRRNLTFTWNKWDSQENGVSKEDIVFLWKQLLLILFLQIYGKKQIPL